MLGWVAVVVGLVAAGVLLLLTITSDTDSPRIETDQPLVTSYLTDQDVTRPEGVPGSADAAERYLANQNATRPEGVPWSADAAERYFANHE